MNQREINELYKEKMVSGGYCPECGDFLIPRKKTRYIVGLGPGQSIETGIRLECINPKCDYKVDLGDDAQVTERKAETDNSISDKLYPENESYHRNAFGSKDIVMCSGQIKRSLLKTVKKSRITDIDHLDQEGKGVIVEYLDEENKLRRELLNEIRIIDE